MEPIVEGYSEEQEPKIAKRELNDEYGMEETKNVGGSFTAPSHPNAAMAAAIAAATAAAQKIAAASMSTTSVPMERPTTGVDAILAKPKPERMFLFIVHPFTQIFKLSS